MKKVLYWFFGIILLLSSVTTPIDHKVDPTQTQAYNTGYIHGQIFVKVLFIALGVFLIYKAIKVKKIEKS